VALAIWYSTKSDRAQRDMLRAAFTGATPRRWKELPKALDDLKWLVDRVDEVAEERNNAIHAPCSLYIRGSENGGSEMGAAFFNGNPRARNLKGKRLLAEFDWCERYAEALSRFTQELETAIAFPDRYPWPERPSRPARRAKILSAMKLDQDRDSDAP